MSFVVGGHDRIFSYFNPSRVDSTRSNYEGVLRFIDIMTSKLENQSVQIINWFQNRY